MSLVEVQDKSKNSGGNSDKRRNWNSFGHFKLEKDEHDWNITSGSRESSGIGKGDKNPHEEASDSLKDWVCEWHLCSRNNLGIICGRGCWLLSWGWSRLLGLWCWLLLQLSKALKLLRGKNFLGA